MRGGDHGRLNVTEAITKSCNYFFAEMGYRLGMDTFLEYLHAFGLGESTGIEIGDAAGILPENPEGQDRAPWAAFGQGNQAYTPLQIANYIATLVSGGELLQPICSRPSSPMTTRRSWRWARPSPLAPSQFPTLP